MTVRVGYDLARPTHHLSLDDGEKIVGINICDKQGVVNPDAIVRDPVNRTALKTSQGSITYSDLEEPWYSSAQVSWANGRGEDDYDEDTQSFFDNYRTALNGNTVILGAKARMHLGARDGTAQRLEEGLTWMGLYGGNKYLCVKFVPNTSYTAENIYLEVRRVGTPTGDLTVRLHSNDGGEPGSVLKSTDIDTDDITDIVSQRFEFTIAGQSLTASTTYWISVYDTEGTVNDYWSIGYDPSMGETNSYTSSDGSSWTILDGELFMAIAEDYITSIESAIFFRYLRGDYCVVNAASGAPSIVLTGDRGFADSNAGALDKLKDGTKSWETDQFAGAVVLLLSGTGHTEGQRWRNIVSNTSTQLTVDEDWIIQHDTTTQYVILGADTWYEVTGHGITDPVTHVLVHNNIVYFCVGEEDYIRRMKFDSSGHSWANDGTNKAAYMTAVFNGTDGYDVWKGNNTDTPSIARADTQDWGVNLVFDAAVPFTDDYGDITNMLEYGTENTLWVLRQGIAFFIEDEVPIKIPLEEMSTIIDDDNGKVALIHNVYLYFNLGSGIERYYGANLDDVGMNRNEGLPSDRQGVVSAMIGRPGEFLASVDAGTDGYSSVYANTGGEAWHEIYRAPATGMRIWSMHFQPVPGDAPDRLIIFVGSDAVSLNYPSLTVDPTHDDNYKYTHEGTITSGYVYSNLFDVDKIFNSLKLFTENLSDDTYIEFDYKLDTDTEWTTIANNRFTESPSQELDFGSKLGVSGKRIRYRLRLITKDASVTPIVKAAVIEAIARVSVKYSYTTNYRATDWDVNLEGDVDTEKADAYDIIEILDDWAENLTPLIMRSTKQPLDNIRVYIDPYSLRPKGHNKKKYINSLTILEV